MIKRYSSQKQLRQVRVRSKLSHVYPRLSVFRSNQYLYAQIIDDTKGRTLVAVRQVKETPSELGTLLAEKALKLKINRVVFDRGSYRYHGRIKALAEGARQQGLKF